MVDNTNGRKWARFTLTLALLVSIAGNVWHTVLATSEISLWMRVPAAVVWPLFTFLGIEILVRMIWERSFTHRLARNLVILPAVPSAIVSYEHLYSLLLMMGEDQFIALIGPLAIDGTLVGCTLALLVTRPSVRPLLPPSAPPSVAEEAETFLHSLPPSTPSAPSVREVLPEWDGEGMSLPPSVRAPSVRRPRAAASPSVVAEAVRAIRDGERDAAIASQEGMPSVSTIERWRRVVGAILADSNAEIPLEWKVPAPTVQVIRETIRQVATP